MKKKPIQVVKAWRYPCERVVAGLEDIGGFDLLNAEPTREKLQRWHYCVCGKSCKPRRIKITVEET